MGDHKVGNVNSLAGKFNTKLHRKENDPKVLQGHGDTKTKFHNSTVIDVDAKDFHEMTHSLRDMPSHVAAHAEKIGHKPFIVRDPGDKMLAVDTQGHNYPRYKRILGE